MTHPAYSNSPERINEIHRLLGRYEEKFELITAIIKSVLEENYAGHVSIYLGSPEIKLIMRILEIRISESAPPPTTPYPEPTGSDPEDLR